MKLALIRRNWSATGGAENYLLRLATRLGGQGFEPHLICESWSGDKGSPFTRVHTIPVRGPRSQRPAAFAHGVNERTRQEPFDCILSLERGTRSDLYRAGDGLHRTWLDKRRRIHPIRGTLANWFNPKNLTTLLLETRTFHHETTGHIIANSSMVRADIRRRFPRFPESRIHTIPNGVDFDTFANGNRQKGRQALGIGPGKVLFLLVGAGAERKGHAQAHEVVNALGSDSAQLIIIDTPPPRPLPDIYAAADVFILPTLYDPFANVTLEAMAAGLPVITTADNGGSEAIEQGVHGYVVPHAAAIADMTASALTLANDPYLRRAMGEAARERARLYPLSGNVASTADLVRKVSSETSGKA